MSKPIQIDTKTFVRFWLVIAALIVLAALVIQARTGLLIVGAAIFLAVAIMPLMKRIDKLNRNKSRPGLAAGIAVGGLVVVLGLFVSVAAPVVVDETSRFVSQAPEQIQGSFSQLGWIDDIGHNFGVNNLREQVLTMVKNAFNGIIGALPKTLFEGVGAISSFLVAVVLVVVLTILFLTQGPGLLNRILKKFNRKSQDPKMTRAKRILSRIAGVISGYVTGQVLVALIDGIVTATAVFILSLIFGFSSGLAIPMGMIAMVMFMIPMFGPVITAILVSAVLLFSNPWAALSFLIFYIIFEQIEGNVISPRIQGGRLDLPPLVILVAATLGMYMFGIVGAIIAIPVAGIIRVLIDEYTTWKASQED